MFFFLVSELFGPEVIQRIVQRNRSRTNLYEMYTTESFVDDFRTLAGEEAMSVLPGWVYEGDYTTFTPEAFADVDSDGMLDFQEILIGTDPTDYDSDDDGQTDFEEMVAGTDPTDSGSMIANKPWQIDGFPGDFPAASANRFAGTQERNDAGKWESLMLTHDAGRVLGVAIEDTEDVDSGVADRITIEIIDSAGHRLQARFIDHAIFSVSWRDGYDGPAPDWEQFVAVYTPLACEFTFPTALFGEGTLEVNVYRWIVLSNPSTRFVYSTISGRVIAGGP
jgi:hypothetical protein